MHLFNRSPRRAGPFCFRTIALLLATAPMARGAFIGSLDGVSNASTFENATTKTTPDPIGWSAVGATTIRTFKGTSGNNSTMIAATGALANYTARYDTGVAINSLSTYTLSADIGFSTSGTPGTGSNGYSIVIGELSAGVFTPLSTYTTSTAYLYNANVNAPYFSAIGSTQFTTSATVDGHDLAVQLARTAPDGTNWLGFDNVTLDAVKVPEPGMLTAAFLSAVATRRRSRNSK